MQTPPQGRRSAIKHTAMLAALLCLAGCAGRDNRGGFSWKDKSGVRHILILGFGAVSVADTNGVNVTDVRAAGLVLDRGVSAGLVQRHHVGINADTVSNAVVSIHATPFSLNVASFDFRQTNTESKLQPAERNPQP